MALKQQGLSNTEIAKRLRVRRATLIAWLRAETYQDRRGWAKGSLRKYAPRVRERVITLKRQRIEKQKYFQGAPYVQMEYAKRYPDEQVPSLWFINESVRQARLQTHRPKARQHSQNIVQRLQFPIKSIVGLGRIQQACDYIGKKYIDGSSEPISILSTGYYQWFEIHQIWRVLGETAQAAVERLAAFWLDHPLPHVLRVDNALIFRGGNHPALLGRFVKFLLNCHITPLFAAPYRSYTNPHIEGHNRTFTEKLWRAHRFTALSDIDRECNRFNAESEEFFRFKFAVRLTAKHLRYRHATSTIDTDSLRSVRGKRVCFIRFVECWRERDQEVGIVILERFIELPMTFLNQYVFVTLELASSTLFVVSETQGRTTLVRKLPFSYHV
ncbi:MAG TPA: hypothetical protein VK629_06305 [Steroidobacteraceae bacterium]|nr:hypothetical protein [Steroidobacteraceae bacterium]